MKKALLIIFFLILTLFGIGGLIFGIGSAVYSLLEEGNTEIALLIVIICFIVFLVIFVKTISFFKKQSVQKRLLKSGQPAKATILKIWETGTTLNNSPQVGMLLEVKPMSKIPYQIEVKHFISLLKISNYQPGKILDVKIDPNNTKNIVIPELSWLNKSNFEKLSSRKVDKNLNFGPTELAKAKILRVIKSEYDADLLLEVYPNNRPSFQSVVKMARGNFYIGKEVFVRYNPSNLTNVWLES